jgi:Mn-dependent DtxR family transcriptional regulator
VVDGFGNSTVWDGTFETDAEALEFVLSEIERDGIDEFIGDPSSPK